MRTVAVVNQKGGSAKTTTSVNVAAGLRNKGLRVLLIDMDPQAHATLHLGISPDNSKGNMHDVLSKGSELDSIIEPVGDGLFVAPSHLALSGSEQHLLLHPLGLGNMQLRKRIGALTTRWDWIIIDCPPTLTLLTYNALIAASELLIPIAAEYLALSGTAQLTETLQLLKDELDVHHRRTAAVVTRFNSHKNLCKAVLQTLREERPFEILETVIRENVKLSEAPAQRTDIFSYDPKCNGAQDYENLVTELTQ